MQANGCPLSLFIFSSIIRILAANTAWVLANKRLIWISLVAQLVKNLPAMHKTWVQSWVGKIPLRRERLPFPQVWPENSMDSLVHGVAKSRTRLRTFTFAFTAT